MHTHRYKPGAPLALRRPISRGALLMCALLTVNTVANSLQTRQPRHGKRIDYSRFSHLTHVNAQKLACDSCHKFPTKNWKDVRKGDAAFPDVAEFPDHASCINCHRPQFFARERPAPAICSNCHIAVTPKDTARWLFPSLGDLTDPRLKRREFVSEFGVGFPHDKHIDVVSRLNAAPRFVSVSFQEKKSAIPASC